MSVSKPGLVGKGLMQGCLPEKRVKYGGKADPTFVRTIAGNARTMREHIEGRLLDDNQTPSAPLNSRGLLGHDHSGPPFGKGLKHTYWWYGDLGGPHLDGETVVSPGNPTSYCWGCKPPLLHRNTENNANKAISFDKSIYIPVPSCYPGGHYETARIDATAYCATAATDGICYLSVYSGAIDPSMQGGQVDLSFDCSTVGWKIDNETITVNPGDWNYIRFVIWSDVFTEDPFECFIPSITLSAV